MVLEVAGHRVERYRRRVPRDDHDLSHRARLDGRGAGAGRRPAGARRPSGRSRTSRSRAGRSSGRSSARWPSIKGSAATVNGELQVIPKDMASAIHDAAAEVATGAHDDHFPIDVFQTGSGTSSNMNMNEVIATLASERSGGRCTRTTTSTRRSRRTTCSRRRSTSPRRASSRPRPDPRARAPREGAAAQAAPLQDSGEGRPHAPDGRHAGDARPGVRRLRHRPSRTASSGSRRRCPASASCPSAAPRSAPASTPRRLRRSAPSPRLADRHAAAAHRGAATTSRPRARATRSSRPSGVCAWSRSRSTRSPTTSGGWGAGPTQGWPRSTSPISSRDRRSCPGKVNPVVAEAVHAGRRAGHRQRRRGRLVGSAGQLRAQRVAAGDRPQPAGVDPLAGGGVAGVRRPLHRTASRPTSSAARVRRVVARRSRPRSTRSSATKPRPRS